MNSIEAARHPLLYGLSCQADWVNEDSFPARRAYADEVEVWLQFMDTKRELSRFLPRLKRNAYQRDRTLAELGVAYFLEARCSLPIIEWEPSGEGETKGEFLVSCAGQDLFVEVKTAGWQKDIVDAEGRSSQRLNQPKYIKDEYRRVAGWQVIRNAVSNSYKKFESSVPNVLIVWDDYYISVDALNNASIALYSPMSGPSSEGYLAEYGCFADHRHERLGAVGILSVTSLGDSITYSFSIYHNPNALSTVRLDQSIFNGYPQYDDANAPK